MKSLSEKIIELMAVCLIGIFTVAQAADTVRPDLTGQIKNLAGEPIPNATVTVVAAWPRQGNNPLCPSCYPDCGKKAVSDAQGNYRIESLDPSLDFYVMALASGYAPTSNSKLHPETGPVSFKLNARDLSKVPTRRHAAGRIIGPDGNPVIGAIIEVGGLERGSTIYSGGGKVDSLGITDDNGEYHITAGEDFDALQAEVRGPGLARRWAKLESGKMQLLRMQEGCSIKGRLAFNGQPLQGVKLGMSTIDRASGVHQSGFEATTDDQGLFVFSNIPPATKFAMFGIMSSFKGSGANVWKQVTSPEDAEPLELGDLNAKKAHRLAGHVVLSDNKPVPPGTRIALSREDAWDQIVLQTDENGKFEALGVPEDKITLNLSVSGYRLSEINPNLDSDHRGLIGRVAEDISNLVIRLEPGNPPGYDDVDHPSYEEGLKRSEKILQSAE
jgi:hypothetical protein